MIFLDLSENCSHRENHLEIWRDRWNAEKRSWYQLMSCGSCRNHKLVGTLEWWFGWIAGGWVWTGLRVRNWWKPQSWAPHITVAFTSRCSTTFKKNCQLSGRWKGNHLKYRGLFCITETYSPGKNTFLEPYITEVERQPPNSRFL